MLKTKDNAVRAGRGMYERVEPIFRSPLDANDDIADSTIRAALGSEPNWVRDGLNDVPAMNRVPSRNFSDSRAAESPNIVQYRALDWLSAIALLIASVAIALALIPHAFY